MRAWVWVGAAASSCVFASVAAAQERPSDADIFGGPAAPAPAPPAASNPPAAPNPGGEPASAPASSAAAPVAAPPAPPAAAAESAPNAPVNARDASILGTGETPMFTEEAAPEDPLRIGGQLYLRAQTTGSRGQSPSNWAFSSPSLLDVYLDARPNDRVRGFVLGRMVYDPTLPTSTTQTGSLNALSATGGTSGSANLSSLFQQQTRTPQLSLDQLWLNFDIAHTAFLTVGKQHVRWGTGHFWTPTDFLHLHPRNPLDVFDARTGTTMVKLHLPIESRAWNFYGYALTENNTATQTLGDIAGAARAELVLGPSELGLGVLAQRNHKAKLAADLSFGVGDFDVYGEAGLRSGGEIDRVSYNANPVLPTPQTPPTVTDLEQAVDAYYPVYRSNGYKAQVVGGLSYAHKYNDNDTFTIGGEYFYNGLGYASPTAYPGLVLPHTVTLNDSANFFYLGRHYAALYISFPAPYSLDNHTFTLSTLGNLSDRSFITRFDYSLIVLTHVRFEAFASARYGNENGEFRFGVTHLDFGGFNFSRAPALVDFGLALRIAI